MNKNTTVEDFLYFSGVEDSINLIESGVFKKGLTFKDSLEVLKASLARVKAEKGVAI